MHIADGILPVEIMLTTDVAALGLVYAGSRKLNTEEIPRMGVFAAALFIVSLIHFPLGGTSIHLGLYGMAGLLFGMRAFPILFVDLLFQSLIFQHGGLLSVGINTITMGSGAMAARAIWKWLPIHKQISSFLCGLLGILIPATFMGIMMQFVYGRQMILLITLYIPAAIIEGLLTIVVYNYFKHSKPELLK